jgi:hypothetical protein
MAVCLLAAGCGLWGEKKVPIMFGTARPSSVKLPIPASAEEMADAGHRPDACRFLTDEEITGLVPQAHRITRRTRVGASVTLAFGRRPWRNLRYDGVRCIYHFDLKDVTHDCRADESRCGANGTWGEIDIVISAIGTADRIVRDYSESLALQREEEQKSGKPKITDRGAALGPQACFMLTSPRLECRQGPLRFLVIGSTISGYAGSYTGMPENPAAAGAVWRDKVLGPVAQLIAAKVP